MRKLIFLLVVIPVFLINVTATSKDNKPACATENRKLTTTKFISLINEAKLCRFDTSKNDEAYYYGYCDPSFYNIYDLDNTGQGQVKKKLYLIEVTHATGTDGYDYYILEKSSSGIKKLNYFKGYLDCIKLTESTSADIIFYSLTDHGRIKVWLTRKTAYYNRKAVLDIEGDNVTSKNKAALLKKYRADEESAVIEKW